MSPKLPLAMVAALVAIASATPFAAAAGSGIDGHACLHGAAESDEGDVAHRVCTFVTNGCAGSEVFANVTPPTAGYGVRACSTTLRSV